PAESFATRAAHDHLGRARQGVPVLRHPASSTVAGRGFFRGRPRPRLRETTAPCSKISPAQTPQGSSRSRAPARQAARIGQSMHSSLARSSSAGDSENHRSASPVWHGNRTPGEDGVRSEALLFDHASAPAGAPPRGRAVGVDKACLLIVAGPLVMTLMRLWICRTHGRNKGRGSGDGSAALISLVLLP